MSDFETGLVVVMTFAVGGMGIVGLVGWIVQHAVKTEAKALHERADRLDGKTDEQSSTLASVSAELHGARTDLTALREEMEGVRGEVDMLAHGPPSMRSPQGPRGKAS
jgi:hypothetical protein